jgi:hypothetical protein
VSAPALIYGLCLFASISCAALLARAYLRSRTRLLLWTSASFCFFGLNNAVLVVDMLLLPGTDLWVWRQAAAGVGLCVLIFGFIWEMR